MVIWNQKIYKILAGEDLSNYVKIILFKTHFISYWQNFSDKIFLQQHNTAKQYSESVPSATIMRKGTKQQWYILSEISNFKSPYIGR